MISMKHNISFFMYNIALCFCLRMVPERTSIDFYDEKYLTIAVFNVRRTGRGSHYYVNIDVTFKQTLGDNISSHIHFYEFLHNEYRSTFVEMHFKELCKVIKFDPLIGKAYRNAGLLTCPIPPKRYILSNLSIPFDNFNYVWPFEKGKAVTTIFDNKTLIAKGTIYMHFTKK